MPTLLPRSLFSPQLLFSLLAALVALPALQAVNLVANHGFETGTMASGWRISGNTSVITTGVHTGSNALDINDNSGTATAAHAQQYYSIPVNENKVYVFSFWVKWVSSFPSSPAYPLGAPPYVQLTQSDSSSTPHSISTNLPISQTNSWVQYKYILGPHGTGADILLVPNVNNLQIGFFAAGVPSIANQGEIIIDDVALEDTGSLLVNADFSSSTPYEYWQALGDHNDPTHIDSSQAIAIAPFVGYNALHIVDGSTSKGSSVSQTISGVSGSQLYAINLDAFASSGNPGFVISQLDASGIVLASTIVPISGASWNHYSKMIGPTGSGADITYFSTDVRQMVIALYGGCPVTSGTDGDDTSTTGEAYYANVIVNPVGLIDNGGFEKGTTGWVTTGSRATGQLAELYTTDFAPGATRSLHLRDTSTLASCSLTSYAAVAPSTDYIVSATAKNLSFGSPSVTGNATVAVSEMTALGVGNYVDIPLPDGTAPTTTQYLQLNSGSWTTTSLPKITTSGNTTALRVQIFAGDNSLYLPANKADPNMKGDVLLDNVTVLPVLATGNTTNLLTHGSLNQGTAGWDKTELEFDGIEISASSDFTHSGAAALKIYDNSATDFGEVHQEVKVMPTGNYYFSFWARTANDGETGYAVLRQLNSDRETVADTTFSFSGSTWTNFTKVIGPTVGSGGLSLNAATRYLLVMFYSDAAPSMTNKATVCVDDVIMYPTAGAPAWSSSPSALVAPLYTVQSISNPFYDSFSGGALYERWVVDSGNPTICDKISKSPPYSLRLGGGDAIHRKLNLTGYTSLSIGYNRKIGNIAPGDSASVDWSIDGTTWAPLETITGAPSDWVAENFALPGGAATSNFQLRLRVVGAASDYCYFDDVQVAGAPDISDFVRSPPMIGLKQQPWLGDYIVHAHSLMPLSNLLTWESNNSPITFPQQLMTSMTNPALDAKVVTAHVHTGDEGYWYKTDPDFQPGAVEDPLVMPPERDIVAEFANAAAAPSPVQPPSAPPSPRPAVRFIGYHWIHSDRYALINHPEWASRDYAGHLVDTARGWALSFSTPYRKYVQNILTYEAGKAFDGFYFDQFDFAYRTGEQTPQLIDLYRTENPSLLLPTNNDPTSPLVKALVSVSQQVVDSSFYQITSALRTVDPQFSVLTAVPNEFTNAPYTFGSADTAAAADTPKIEMGIPLRIPVTQTGNTTSSDQALPFQGVQLSLAEVTARDSGRKLPHTWNTRRDVLDPKAGYLQSMVGLAATNGFYMNFQTLQSEPRPFQTQFESDPPAPYEDAIKYGNSLSPDLRGRSYLTWVAVYVSQHVRSDTSAWPTLNSAKNAYVGTTYGQYAWPIFGAVQTLQEQHVPWGVVTDREVALGPLDPLGPIGQFRNIKVIVVPHWSLLTAAERTSLSTWQAAGGQLVTTLSDGTYLDDTKNLWQNPDKQQDLFSALWNAITNNGSLQPPIQVVSPSNDPSFKRTLAGFMRTTNGTVVVSLLNSVDWMDVRSESWQTLDKNGNQINSNGTPPASFTARIVVHSGYSPVWAKFVQPSSTSVTGTTSTTLIVTPSPTNPTDKTIDVPDIAVHAVVVLDDEY